MKNSESLKLITFSSAKSIVRKLSMKWWVKKFVRWNGWGKNLWRTSLKRKINQDVHFPPGF